MASQVGLKFEFRTPLSYNNLASTNILGVANRHDEDELGMIRYEIDGTNGMQTYRFIQLDGASTGSAVAGNLIVTSDVDRMHGSTAFADAIADRNLMAGVAIGAITSGNKGWVQTGGFTATPVLTKTGVTFAAGDIAIHGGSGQDTKIDKIAAGSNLTYLAVGVATAATSSSKTQLYLMISPW